MTTVDMVNIPLPRITARPFEGEQDYQRVRDLLIQTYALTPTGWNWDVRRWEGRRYYGAARDLGPSWAERVHLWEDAHGRLVGTVLDEGAGEAHL